MHCTRNKAVIWLAAMLLLTILAGTALAEVTITEAQIESRADDLQVDYRYPTFAAGDDALTKALDLAITQDCVARYDTLHAEYESAVTERDEEYAAQFENPDFYDEIIGTYDVKSNGALVQIVCQYTYWPTGGNGNWDKVAAYCFDTDGMALRTPADFFTEDAATVYAKLSEIATEKATALEYHYDDAQAEIGPDTAFYYDAEADALCFLFDPYTLSAQIDELTVPVYETGLSFQTLAATLSNPMREVDQAEIEKETGITIAPPAGAHDVAYYLYEVSGAAPMAECVFIADGVGYTYRAQAADAREDISGVYATYDTTEDVTVGANDGVLMAAEGEVGVCLWYDADHGQTYSLMALLDQGGTPEALLDMANSVFVPA